MRKTVVINTHEIVGNYYNGELPYESKECTKNENMMLMVDQDNNIVAHVPIEYEDLVLSLLNLGTYALSTISDEKGKEI